MNDCRDHLEALRKQAAEAALISALATSPKRELFAKIAEHLNTLAGAVEQALKAGFMSAEGKPTR